MFGDVIEYIYIGFFFYIIYLLKICYFIYYNKNMDIVVFNDNGYLY